MIRLLNEKFEKGKPPSERSVEEKLRFGVVIIDKPLGPTSHETASFVKKILHLSKTGHTGTLDHNVSGVLVVLLEDSCKTAVLFKNNIKTYVGVLKLESEVKEEELRKAVKFFVGDIYQKPPLASAVAKKLRIRKIYNFEILEKKGLRVLFKARVDAGTYIRTLCFHLGEVLGVGGGMEELRRIESGFFKESQAVILQKLVDAQWLYSQGKGERLNKMVLNIEDVLEMMKVKKVIASDYALHSISTGANLAIPGIIEMDDFDKNEVLGIFNGKGELVCIGKALMSSKDVLKSKNGIAIDVDRVIHAF
jgi:H/ACA ribonucleoprotein complex subunit 4